MRLIPSRSPFANKQPGQIRPPTKASETATLRPSEVLAKSPEAKVKAVIPPVTAAVPIDTSLPPALPGTEAAEKKLPASGTTYAFGGGIDRLPRWQGSGRSEIRLIPYIDINWRDQVQFSTVKGLIIDVLHGERWHGGLIGTMVWGRSTKDLAGLNVSTLQNTLQGGLYLEYALTPEASIGLRLRQDLQNTGVSYGELYAELDLPKIGYLEHDLRFSLEGMNQTGMRRFFGVSPRDAANLGVAVYRPAAGVSKLSLTYEGFMPTSESTGLAFAATIGRLGAGATDSPLVRNFGSPWQKELVAAFIYHF